MTDGGPPPRITRRRLLALGAVGAVGAAGAAGVVVGPRAWRRLTRDCGPAGSRPARVAGEVQTGSFRTSLNVDIFNALNDNAVLTENASFAVFRQPLSVLNPRLIKVSANIDF